MSDGAETFDSLWAYCIGHNRLVPMHSLWNDLFRMLMHTRQQASGSWEPSLPLILAAWDNTMPVMRQLRFKEHIQWAHDQGQLEEIGTYLRSLPEDGWCHFGEI